VCKASDHKNTAQGWKQAYTSPHDQNVCPSIVESQQEQILLQRNQILCPEIEKANASQKKGVNASHLCPTNPGIRGVSDCGAR